MRSRFGQSAAGAILNIAANALLFATISVVARAQRVPSLQDEPHHRLVWENKSVRVFDFQLPAETRTESYGSQHDLIVLALADSQLTELRLGQDSEILSFRKGEPQAISGGLPFSLRNQKDVAFRAMVVELLLPRPPPPDCGCKPSGAGVGCGCGVGGGSVGDGTGNWVHGRTVGQIGIDTYGLQPIATFTSKVRPGPLPEFLVRADDRGKLLIAIDDIEYRFDGSHAGRYSWLVRGGTLSIEQETWIRYPQPANCSWDNFLVDGKVSSTCVPSVFVVLGVRLEATNRK
jgi:hypothetical protein